VVGHHPSELADVVRDPVEVDGALVLDRDGLGGRVKTQKRASRQQEGAAQIDIAVRRREAVEVGAADRGEHRLRPPACD